MSYDYGQGSPSQMNMNLIDHRPSLLVSTQQLMNRPKSPQSIIPARVPTQNIYYHSLAQNCTPVNLEKFLTKNREAKQSTFTRQQSSITASTRRNSLNIFRNSKEKKEQRSTMSITETEIVGHKKVSIAVYRREQERCALRRKEMDLRRGPVLPTTNSSRLLSANDLTNFQSNLPNSSTPVEKSTTSSSMNSNAGNRCDTSTNCGISNNSQRNGSGNTAALPNKSKTIKGKASYKKMKHESLKHIFVVNGSVVCSNGYSFESFTNWFGDESMLRKEKDSRATGSLHKVLNMSGFTNQEIRMKLYDGNKLVVEASRPPRGRYPAMRLKEVVWLQEGSPVESLIVCRTKSGRLIIQDTPRPTSAISTTKD